MPNKPQLEITPISGWLDDYETVKLPSGKVVGLRQVDVLNILTVDGEIPNILIPAITGHMALSQGDNQNLEMGIEDLVQLNNLLDRLARACFVNPKIVADMDAVDRGEGITVEMVSYIDKTSLIAWNMGGQAQLDATATFLNEQEPSMVTVQPSGDIQPKPESDS